MPCVNCEHEIPNRLNYYFCSNCVTQVRCKKCSEPLEKSAKGCFNCGTKIGEDQLINNAINNVEFEQKGDSKKFKANFTDFVGENFVQSFGAFFMGTPGIRLPQSNPFANSTKNPQNIPAISSTKLDNPSFEYAKEVDDDEETLNLILAKIFKHENEELSLINQRLKQTGKRDHAIRITLVALYGYSIINQPQVSRTILTKMLKSAACYDQNYLAWLGKCDEVKKVDSDLLELNLPGRDSAIEILKEFANPGIEKGNIQFSGLGSMSKRTKGKRGKSEADGTETTSSKTGGTRSSSLTPTKMIDALIAENYFKEKRRINEIVKYCKDTKAWSVSNNSVNTVLTRKVKSRGLKREQNSSDKQYDYFQ